jgi:hypothetical protein
MTAGRGAPPEQSKTRRRHHRNHWPMAASEWMRPNTTRVMLYKSISHRSPPVRKRNDASRAYAVRGLLSGQAGTA